MSENRRVLHSRLCTPYKKYLIMELKFLRECFLLWSLQLHSSPVNVNITAVAEKYEVFWINASM